MDIRKQAVAGMFYPKKYKEITTMFDSFKSNIEKQQIPDVFPRILIVPHAGYVYSGFTAMHAYLTLKKYKNSFENVVIIAPSHRYSFNGLSLSEFSEFQLFDKLIPNDLNLVKLLKRKFNFDFIKKAHLEEHSAEVQFPFLDYFLDNFKLTTIEHSFSDFNDLSRIIEFLLDDEKTIVIISSDLSHFYKYNRCIDIDRKCLEGISTLDLDLTNKGEACGMTGILAAIECAKRKDLSVKKLHYCNSGDITGDKSSVVGYASFVFS